MQLKNGQTSVVLRVKLLNSSVSTGAGLTGLTSASPGLVIGTIADTEAVTTSYTQAGGTIETIATLATYAAPTATKIRFKEVDASVHPGIYEIQIADARLAVSGAKYLIISINGASNLAQCEFRLDLTQFDPYDTKQLGIMDSGVAQAVSGTTITLRAGVTFGTSTPIGATVFVTNGATGAFERRIITAYDSATKIATVDAWSVTPTGTVSYIVFATAPASSVGTIASNITQVNGNATAATNLRLAYDGTGYKDVDNLYVIETGTAQAGAAGTITLHAGASAADDFYKNNMVQVIAGTGSKQARMISAYNGTTKVATVSDPWATPPANDSVFIILPVARPNVIATSVTDKTGYALSLAGVDGVLDAAITKPSAVVATGGWTLRSIIGWLGALSLWKIKQTTTLQTLRNETDTADVATAVLSDDGSGLGTRNKFQ